MMERIKKSQWDEVGSVFDAIGEGARGIAIATAGDAVTSRNDTTGLGSFLGIAGEIAYGKEIEPSSSPYRVYQTPREVEFEDIRPSQDTGRLGKYDIDYSDY